MSRHVELLCIHSVSLCVSLTVGYIIWCRGTAVNTENQAVTRPFCNSVFSGEFFFRNFFKRFFILNASTI